MPEPSAAAAHDAFVGLGGNLGDAAGAIRAALGALAQLPGTRVVAVSSLYRSAAHEVPDPQPDYVNAVARLATTLGAADLLAALLAIEARLGRVRSSRSASRTIDLDLLLYDQVRLDTPSLTLPHPRLHARAFVLLPLLEIDPDLVVPGRGRARGLLAGVTGQRIERVPGETA